MAGKTTPDQATFITDLVLAKFRNFIEFRKWLATTGIVRTNGQIFSQGMTLVDILNRITQEQATQIITAMQQFDDVPYKTAYNQDQIDEVSAILKRIEERVKSWTFTR